MNWAHALLMAELLLKAADQINTFQSPADMKKEATMADEAPIETPQPVVSDPTTVTGASGEGGQIAAPTQSAEAAPVADVATTTAPASATTQDIIASAVDQAPASSNQTAIGSATTAAQSGTTGAPTGTDTTDALLKGVSDLLVLAKILDANPDLFAFLKTLISGAQTNQSKSTPT